MLVENTLHTHAHHFTFARREESAGYRAKTHHILVLRGKLRTAVQWITERETGGVLHPRERCTKTGKRVMEVLRTEHPEARTQTAASLY